MHKRIPLFLSSLFLVLALQAADLESLDKAWSQSSHLSEVQRSEIKKIIQQAKKQDLPTEGLVNRVLEGTAKKVEPALIISRVESLIPLLAAAQSMIGALKLDEKRSNREECVEGIATLFSLEVSSITLMEIRGLWPQNPSCLSLLKTAESDRLAESAEVGFSERRALIKRAIDSGHVDRLPYLWMKARHMGLKNRQVFNVLRKDMQEGLSEDQILSDFERVSELLELPENP